MTKRIYIASNGSREITIPAKNRAHAALKGRNLLNSAAVTINGEAVPVEELEAFIAQRDAFWQQRDDRTLVSQDTAAALYVG